MNAELHPFGALSLLPSVVAIALAIMTRRLILSMLAGIYVGALLTVQFNPLQALGDTWEIHLWRTLIEPDRLRVFSFTLLMGALIGVVTRSGGMQGLITKVTPLAKTRRRGQITAWVMGMIVFFDDYANTLLLGPTMRPIADRLKISREKLAYIVDSTAAPVAGLSLVSTWVAVEISYVQSGLTNVDASLEDSAFALFVASIPYRFYIWFALLLVPLVAIFNRDLGSMWRAEQSRAENQPVDSRHPNTDPLLDDIRPSHWLNAVLPIAVTVGLVMVFIYRSGVQVVGSDASLTDIMGEANPAMALQYGAFGGLALAAFLTRLQGILTPAGIVEAGAAGARVVAPAILILWCASTISSMTGNESVDGEASVGYEHKDHRLYTGDYLKSVLIVEGSRNGDVEPDNTAAATNLEADRARFPLFLLPSVIFVLSGIVAFCTGTSWGTMGILMPIVVPMVYALVGTLSPNDILQHPLMLGSVGGVLSGAIFGDHCSPISDTTVLSSQSCSCDHIAHVSTQMPYALSVGGICVFLGTLPLGLGVPLWVLLPLQAAGVLAMLLFFGKPVVDRDLVSPVQESSID